MIFPDSSRRWLGEFVKLSALEPLANSIGKWQGRGDVIDNLWETSKITAAGPVYMLPRQFITFYSGNTAMFAHHVGSSVLVTTKLGAGSVGVVPIPAADPKKPATMATMVGNVVFAGSKQAAPRLGSGLTLAAAMVGSGSVR
jgi:hypothetical protein